MIEEITLDMLTRDSVSVKKQYFQGQPWRRAYVNSPSGRAQLNDEPDEIIPQAYKDAILLAWGDSPTVDDPSVD